MKLGRDCLCFLISLVACAMVACNAQTAGTNASRTDDSVQKHVDDMTSRSLALGSVNASDAVSVYLGSVHMIIPRGYLGMGSFAIQTTDHLVLDVQLPDIRPMTKGELNRYGATGLKSPDTATIILEEGDNYLYGDRLFQILIKDKSLGALPNSYISPKESGMPNLIFYHHNRNDVSAYEDVYLLKDSSPKFFFECKEETKFIVAPDCAYFGQLTGNVRFHIEYDKNHYFHEIVRLTPKIKALLLSFVKP